MGLVIAFFLFWVIYAIYFLWQLLSLPFSKNKKASRKKLVIVVLMTFPLWQFLLGKSAIDYYYKDKSGYHFIEEATPDHFFIDGGIEQDMLNDLKTGKINFIETSGKNEFISRRIFHTKKLNSTKDEIQRRKKEIQEMKSSFYRVTSVISHECKWDAEKRWRRQDIVQCFSIKKIDQITARFSFKKTVSRDLFLLPIRKDKWSLYDRVNNRESAYFLMVQFYRCTVCLFRGEFFPKQKIIPDIPNQRGMLILYKKTMLDE